MIDSCRLGLKSDYDQKLKTMCESHEKKLEEMARTIANMQNIQLMSSKMEQLQQL